MKLKQSIINLAVLSALGMGVVNEAAASVYAVSTIEIQNLSVFITEDGVTPSSNVTVRSFNYALNNTAALNNVGAFTTNTCGGSVASNNCGPSGSVLDVAPANAPGNTVVSANNAFALQGPGADQYSRSDSVIYTSQLSSAGIDVTHQQQGTESELQNGISASATSNIQSITGLTFAFTVATPGNMVLSFQANAYMQASSNDPEGQNQSAQANIAVSGTLQRDVVDANYQQYAFSPDGTGVSSCIALGLGATCSELADAADIGGNNIGISTDPAFSSFSTGGFGNYRVVFSGLKAGDYTFTLRSETSTQLARTTIPEPGVILLMGIGMLGMSLGMRRNGRFVA